METAPHKRCTAGGASRAQKRSSEDGLRCPNTLVPLNFEPREFDPMNGAGGRVPLLMEEYEKIGLQNPTVEKSHYSADRDIKAYHLLRFVYAFLKY